MSPPIPTSKFEEAETFMTKTVKPKASSHLNIPSHLLPSDPLLRDAKVRSINAEITKLQRAWKKSWAHERGATLRECGVTDNDKIKELANHKAVPYEVIAVKVLREMLPRPPTQIITCGGCKNDFENMEALEKHNCNGVELVG